MTKELLKIKKVYGETMMHLCRELFPTILDDEGVLYDLLTTTIAPTKTLAQEIIDKNLVVEFKNYIYSFIRPDIFITKTDKTPFELLESKGYKLYECKSNEQINEFKKYYAPGEELCTFNSDRLLRCDVFFAVRDDAELLKRETFTEPKRQDAYGTSVLSIQFSRMGVNTPSIKNRYNHTVENPDATFSNNLDAIVKGLTYSFEKYYNLKICPENDLYAKFLTEDLKCIKANDGKYYKYNTDEENTYYCENNIIITNGDVEDKYNKSKERYIVMDSYILDLKEKKMFKTKETTSNAFIESVNLKNDSIIELRNSGIIKEIIIHNPEQEDIIIYIDKSSKIVGYRNNNVEHIGDGFLYNNKTIKYIEMNNVKTIGNDFLCWNLSLKKLCLPKVQSIKDCFMYFNKSLREVSFPEVKEIGNQFCFENNTIEKDYMPLLELVGSDFMCWNTHMKKADFPNLSKIGDNFFGFSYLEEINAPNISEIGNNFLRYNKNVKNVYFPFLTSLGRHFMPSNEALNYLYMPMLKEISCGFLRKNKEVGIINVESLEKIKNDIYVFDNNPTAKEYLLNTIVSNNKVLRR